MSNPTPEARAVALFSDIRHDDCCDDPGCQVSYIRFPDGQHIEIGTRDMHVERLDVLGANVAAADHRRRRGRARALRQHRAQRASSLDDVRRAGSRLARRRTTHPRWRRCTP
jgi:hypothetical protein